MRNVSMNPRIASLPALFLLLVAVDCAVGGCFGPVPRKVH